MQTKKQAFQKSLPVLSNVLIKYKLKQIMTLSCKKNTLKLGIKQPEQI